MKGLCVKGRDFVVTQSKFSNARVNVRVENLPMERRNSVESEV